MKIVVGTNGFVWIAEEVVESERWFTMTNARIIRTWGTSKGLAELVDGPTKETVLDTNAGIVELAWHAVLWVMPCNHLAWNK
jgi:exosome complex RNA-binding protein Rrp4